jgi:glycosyl transferase family 87
MQSTLLRRTLISAKSRGWLWFLGLALLGCWLAWWGISLYRNRLLFSEALWPFSFPYLGHDLKYNYAAANVWMDGGNPYAPLVEHHGRIFGYPPSMLWFFTWCRFVNFQAATWIWFAALLGVTFAACLACRRWRERTLQQAIPWPLALAALLFSTPMLFAFERGQCDHLVLALLLGGLAALRDDNPWRQRLAGVLFAFAASIKLYPGLFIVGLVTLRRWQASAAFLLTGILLVLTNGDAIRKSHDRLQEISARYTDNPGVQLSFKNHSLTGTWRFLFQETPLASSLGRIPGAWAAGILLASLVGAVSWRLWRTRRRAEMALPYFLWLMTAATFFPPIAFDYNLIFLPLVILAVWDRRDPVPVHLAIGLCFLSLQPFWLQLGGRVLLCGKLAGLFATGWCVVRRAAVLSVGPETDAVSDIALLHRLWLEDQKNDPAPQPLATLGNVSADS